MCLIFAHQSNWLIQMSCWNGHRHQAADVNNANYIWHFCHKQIVTLLNTIAGFDAIFEVVKHTFSMAKWQSFIHIFYFFFQSIQSKFELFIHWQPHFTFMLHLCKRTNETFFSGLVRAQMITFRPFAAPVREIATSRDWNICFHLNNQLQWCEQEIKNKWHNKNNQSVKQ